MILWPDPLKVAEAAAKLRQRGTVRDVPEKGKAEDEAELRAFQRESKRRSRARKGIA